MSNNITRDDVKEAVEKHVSEVSPEALDAICDTLLGEVEVEE